MPLHSLTRVSFYEKVWLTQTALTPALLPTAAARPGEGGLMKNTPLKT